MTKKGISGLVALIITVLLAGSVGIIAWLSKGFKDWTVFENAAKDTAEYFKPAEDSEGEDEDNGSDVDFKVTDVKGVSVVRNAIPRSSYAEYGVEDSVYELFLVKATIDPSYATNKRVSWSLQWPNPNNPPAGPGGVFTIESYLSFWGISGDTLTCTICVLHPCSSKIILKCASESDPGVFATCDIDFGKRPTRWFLHEDSGVQPYESDTFRYNIDYANNRGWDIYTEWNNVYSVDLCGNKLKTKVYIEYTEEFKQKLMETSEGSFTADMFERKEVATHPTTGRYLIDWSDYNLAMMASGHDLTQITDLEEFRAAIAQTEYTLKVTVEANNGGEWSETKEYYFTLYYPVSSVSLSQNSIVV